MPKRPTGTVTFLFTDIEGSTRLLQLLSDEYARVLGEHFEILRDALAKHGGHEESTEGDSIFAVFPGAVDAVEAAVEAQRDLVEHDWPSDTAVRVRMGLHSGEAAYGPDGYVGIDVHRAARVSSVAHGGQILLSASTTALVANTLPAGVTLQSLGSHRLKDLSEPEPLSQVVAPGLDREFPILRSLDAVSHNLPVQLTNFIGREKQLRDVSQLVSENRLVTFTGVGGTGKTRLALQVGAEIVDGFPDGVWVVDLAPVASGEMVDNALAAALGVRDQPGRTLIEVIGDALRTRTLLLILDNTEHLLNASAEVATELLGTCPEVRILATSREPLGLPGEAIVPIPPLVAPPKTAKTADALVAYDSAALFEDRAALARPGFRIDDENSAAVAQICRRLDAVPLAIELAAARVRVLTPKEIAGHLDDRFRLLTGGGRGAVPHQQTLEATVAWSYELLSDSERLLFDRLAVFGGSLTLDAAEFVAESDGVDRWDVLDLITGLVEKSMLLVDRDDHSGSRYRLLETLRQFAMARLIASGTSDHFHHRHATYFADLAERGDQNLRGPDQAEWFGVFRREHDNFAAALEWTLETGAGEIFLRVATALAFFWSEMGNWEEGRHWLQAKPARDELSPTAMRAKAMIQVVSMMVPEDPRSAFETARHALDLSEAASDDSLRAHALQAMGYTSTHMFLPDQAVSLLEEALAIFRSLDDRWGEASTLGTLSNAVSYSRTDTAAEMIEESLRIFEDLGDRLYMAESLYLGASIAHRQDRPQDAVESGTRALALYRQMGAGLGEGHTLRTLGQAKSRLGQPSEAREDLEDALGLLTDVGDAHCSARVQYELGWLDLDEGDPGPAERRFREALIASRRVDDKLNLAWTLEGMGRVARQTGDDERATVLVAVAEQLRDGLEVPRSPEEERRHQGLKDELRGQLDTVFGEAWERGRAMGLEQAVAFVLGHS